MERFRDIEAAAREKTGRRELDIEAAASRLGRTVLELDHVGARYDGHDYIKDFSYIVLRRDRVGILGPNGAGKTTLLNILAGRRDPDTGSVRRGQTVKIGYFSQTSEFPDPRERVLEYIRDAGEYVTTADGTRVSAAMMLERRSCSGSPSASSAAANNGGFSCCASLWKRRTCCCWMNRRMIWIFRPCPSWKSIWIPFPGRSWPCPMTGIS